MWAARIVHESMQHDSNCFITLTYNNDNLPYSLSKRDWQLFMKTARRNREGEKLKYFHCGEYDDNWRPHYHGCMFNLAFPDRELFKSREGINLYTSAELEKWWPYGYSSIGELTFESAAYVARYTLKKVTGDKADDHYQGREPEYITMSNGIGKEFYEDYRGDFFPADETPVPGSRKPIIKKVPRYYEKLLGSEMPELLQEVKDRRQDFRRKNWEEYTPERLRAKYKVKQAQVDKLRRS